MKFQNSFATKILILTLFGLTVIYPQNKSVKKFLKDLEPTIMYFENLKSKISGMTKDRADAEYRKMLDERPSPWEITRETDKMTEKNVKEYKKQLPLIFTINSEAPEGEPYFALSYDDKYIRSMLDPYLSDEMRNGLDLYEKEWPIFPDQLSLALNRYSGQIKDLEDFIVSNKDCKISDLLKIRYNSMLYLFLAGSKEEDGTEWLFIWEGDNGDILSEAARVEYEFFLEICNNNGAFGKSFSCDLVRKYYQALKKNNFRRTEATDQILAPINPTSEGEGGGN